jgi:hypothetical protein
MWDEALECPHLNPLPEGEYVFSVALIYPIFPISLTPGFSEVQGRSTTTTAKAVCLFTDKKPLKRFGAPSGVINTQLRQGVN